MVQSISAYLDIPARDFAATGAFDAVLEVDSKLFIDPHLLRFTTAPELANSYQKMLDHFSKVIKLLAHSTRRGDKSWQEAEKLLRFNEVKGLCIGYSSASTSGSGMGAGFRRQLLQTAKTIVNAGIQDPEFFELLGLFEEGVGADRISDMVARIIIDDLLIYSQRTLTELGVEDRLTTWTYGDNSYQLARNPYNNWPIILIPMDILRDLPMAYGLSDVGDVVEFNERLRARLNQLLGISWKEAKKLTKGKVRTVLLGEPDILRQLIAEYRGLPARPYNFENDPAGQFIWFQKAREYAEQYPLDLRLLPFPSADDVLTVVHRICEQFKQLIELNGLHTLLYRDDACTEPKREEAAQRLFFGIADAYCQSNNLDLSPEVNSGRGQVDFKISRGYNSRVLVETKLTSNPRLQHGYETQLTEYQKAEKTHHAIFLVIDVGGYTKPRYKAFLKAVEASKQVDQRVPDVIIVDAVRKPSASKMTD